MVHDGGEHVLEPERGLLVDKLDLKDVAGRPHGRQPLAAAASAVERGGPGGALVVHVAENVGLNVADEDALAGLAGHPGR